MKVPFASAFVASKRLALRPAGHRIPSHLAMTSDEFTKVGWFIDGLAHGLYGPVAGPSVVFVLEINDHAQAQLHHAVVFRLHLRGDPRDGFSTAAFVLSDELALGELWFGFGHDGFPREIGADGGSRTLVSNVGAENEDRTRNPQFGRLVLYR